MNDIIPKCNTLSYDDFFFPHLSILQKHLERMNFYHQYSIPIETITHVHSTSNSLTTEIFIPEEKLWLGSFSLTHACSRPTSSLNWAMVFSLFTSTDFSICSSALSLVFSSSRFFRWIWHTEPRKVKNHTGWLSSHFWHTNPVPIITTKTNVAWPQLQDTKTDRSIKIFLWRTLSVTVQVKFGMGFRLYFHGDTTVGGTTSSCALPTTTKWQKDWRNQMKTETV